MAPCCLCGGHLVCLDQWGRTKQFHCRDCGLSLWHDFFYGAPCPQKSIRRPARQSKELQRPTIARREPERQPKRPEQTPPHKEFMECCNFIPIPSQYSISPFQPAHRNDAQVFIFRLGFPLWHDLI